MDISPLSSASYPAQAQPSRTVADRSAVQSGRTQASVPANPATAEKTTSPTPAKRSTNSGELTDEQRAQVAKLQSRDREVRAHEGAHLAAAGGLARGGASFSYTTGPDNRRYAVGGEVSIDTSPADSPEKTIQKAQTIQAAALAPAKPSSQDSAVAASAAKMAAQARAELSAERAQESKDVRASAQSDAVKSYTRTAAMSDEKEPGNNVINVIA